MKTPATSIQCPLVKLNKVKALRLIAIGGSIQRVAKKKIQDHFKRLLEWILISCKGNEDIPYEFQLHKEEIISERLKHQLPPRFLLLAIALILLNGRYRVQSTPPFFQ